MSEDRIDSMPFGDYEAERNEEPPDNVTVLVPRCQHPFVDSVCTDCGLVVLPTRMHPEET